MVPAPSRRSIILAIEGISASGKSTLVARAASALGWVALSEAYERLDPRPGLTSLTVRSLARTERTLLEEEGRRWRTARALSAHGTTVIADTGFLGPITYTWGLAALGRAPWTLLDDLVRGARRMAAEGAWGMPDAVVYLATPPSIRAGRARSDRIRHPPALRRRHEAVGRIEERFYRCRLAVLFPRRVSVLDGNAPLPAQVHGLERAARNILPAPRSTDLPLRILGAFDRRPAQESPVHSTPSGNR